MDNASKSDRMQRAAETLARYEYTDEDELDDCLEDVPPMTEREELEEMMDLIEAFDILAEEAGW